MIFDEAHNLENVASEAASFELTSAQIAGAQEEALRCHKIFTEGGGADQVGTWSRGRKFGKALGTKARVDRYRGRATKKHIPRILQRGSSLTLASHLVVSFYVRGRLRASKSAPPIRGSADLFDLIRSIPDVVSVTAIVRQTSARRRSVRRRRRMTPSW